MPNLENLSKKPANLSGSKEQVRESRVDWGNHSAKVEEMLQNQVVSEQELRWRHRQQALQAVVHWNTLHDAAGSYADGRSTL